MPDSIGQFLSGGDSLIAPLDIARFVLAYLALVFLPGFGFATLVQPRLSRTARLALAIPCAYAIITLFGLATVWLRLPFDATTYLAIVAPILLASGYQAASALRSRRHEETKPESGIWPLAPVITAMLQLTFLGAVFVHRAVPSGADVVTHIMYIAQIAHTHSFPLVLLNSSNSNVNVAQGGFYPPAFHAETALALNAVPMPPYRAGFYSIAMCVAFLPVGLYAYVRQVTGSMRAAGIATLSALTFGALPSTMVSIGLYPFVASQLFIPAFAMTFVDAILRRSRRSCLLASLIGIGLFYTHPTELLTAALLAGTGLMVCARRCDVWLCVAAYAVTCGVTLVLAALPVIGAVRNTIVVGAANELQLRHFFNPSPHVSLSGALDQYLYGMFTRNVSYILMVLVIIGCIYCFAQHRYRALAIMQFVLCAIYIDANTFDVLQRFYILSFPWALGYRLVPTNYWFALPLAGIGSDTLIRRLGHNFNPAALRLAIAPVITVSLVLSLSIGTLHDIQEGPSNILTHPSDLHALAWLDHHAPTNSVVVNEALFHNTYFEPPMDAAVWLPALTAAQPLVSREGTGPGSSDDRQYLLEHITDVPLPARAARFIRRYHVRYAFYGAQVYKGFIRYMTLSALLADPKMTLAYSSAASCRPHSDVRRSACPTTASYVFALHLRGDHINQVARISHGARQG